MIISISQTVIFTAYLAYVHIKVGIQKSLSESWYALEDKGWMFTVLMCFSIGILQAFHPSVWFFFSGASLILVGTATDFKSTWKPASISHYLGALLSIVLALLGLYFEAGIWWPICPILIGIAMIKLFKVKNEIWWIEVICFYSIIIGEMQMY